MTCEERWMPIKNYEGSYEVSDQGQVRSVTRWVPSGKGMRLEQGRLKSQQTMHRGHKRVWLMKQGMTRACGYQVHRLVLEAFVGPCPPGRECCHGDGNPANNNVSNLRWGTRSENVHDSLKHGTQYPARNTRCAQGHRWTPDTTIARNGQRVCHLCHRLAQRRYESRKQAVSK